jgi:hypothetical protein
MWLALPKTARNKLTRQQKNRILSKRKMATMVNRTLTKPAFVIAGM